MTLYETATNSHERRAGRKRQLWHLLDERQRRADLAAARDRKEPTE